MNQNITFYFTNLSTLFILHIYNSHFFINVVLYFAIQHIKVCCLYAPSIKFIFYFYNFQLFFSLSFVQDQ